MRILLIKTRLPYPLRAGSDLVNYGLIKALAERHEVTLIAPVSAPSDTTIALPELSKYCAEIATFALPDRSTAGRRAFFRLKREFGFWVNRVPLQVADIYTPDLAKTIRDVLQRKTFDLAEVEFWQTGQCVSDLQKACPAILLQHDTIGGNIRNDTHAQTLSLATKVRNAYYRHSAMAQYEANICRLFDWIFFLSSGDRELNAHSRSIYNHSSVLPVPYCIREARVCRDGESDSLIFVGSMLTPYNVESLVWFCRSVLPILLERRPHLSLTVAGIPPCKSWMSKFPHGRVRYAGFQSDLQAEICRHDVYIAPVRTGTGIRTKIIEALAQGIPVVSTSLGVSGLTVTDGTDILIADEPEDFAARVIALLEDTAFRRRIGQGALSTFRSTYKYEAVKDATLRSYEEVYARVAGKAYSLATAY